MMNEFNTPNIIRETNLGFSSYRIVDDMLSHREIQCVGEINAESVYSLIMQLQYLQREAPNEEITMYINSPGGEVTSGLALYDVMQAISAPCVWERRQVWHPFFLPVDRNVKCCLMQQL